MAQLEMTEMVSNVKMSGKVSPFEVSTCCSRRLRVNCTITQSMVKVIGLLETFTIEGSARGEGLVTLIFSVNSQGGEMRPPSSLEHLFLLCAQPAPVSLTLES